jgi:hypothetical protein
MIAKLESQPGGKSVHGSGNELCFGGTDRFLFPKTASVCAQQLVQRELGADRFFVSALLRASEI